MMIEIVEFLTLSAEIVFTATAICGIVQIIDIGTSDIHGVNTMGMDTKYLLIDSADSELSDVKTILSFMELSHISHVLKDVEKPAKIHDSIETILIASSLLAKNTSAVLRQIREHYPNTPILSIGILAPNNTPDVIDHLNLPIVKNTLLPALRHCRHHLQTQRMQCNNFDHELSNLVGISRKMQQLRSTIIKVARSDTSVLILGDSGTGKEIVASSIHKLSTRADKPFVPINCGAIPAELLESELFGHEKGAFTGALSQRIGRFQLANGGTLFLDEIGDMPLNMQVKILRVLQERVFERIGSNTSIETDVRIIAATHQNLEQHIKEGLFRQDLYYRLNVFPLHVASLSERLEDIPVLVDHLSENLQERLQCTISFTDAAKAVLSQHSWPGNIRELANLVERMMVMFPNDIVDEADLLPLFQPESNEATTTTQQIPAGPINLKQHMAQLEVDLIKNALVAHKGVISRAAKSLSMGRTTLIEKMRKYEIRYQKERQLTQ